MKLSYFVFLAMMVGMVGCEKEPEAPKINIKRSTVQEIEDSMAASMAAAEANKKINAKMVTKNKASVACATRTTKQKMSAQRTLHLLLSFP